MLQAKGISTGYGKKQVLFDVSLEVKAGEIVLLVGSNGSGKSSLLKVIYGLLSLWQARDKKEGKVVFDGEDISGLPTAQLLKRGLLYIPQQGALFENLNVKENLEMAGLTISNHNLRERIDYALGLFPVLTMQLRRTPMKLSGGERKLLSLAMAMLHQPKIVLIDEPLAGLSGKAIGFVLESFRALSDSEGVGLLIVEHRVREILEIADSVIGLKLGRIVYQMGVNTNFNIAELNTVFI